MGRERGKKKGAKVGSRKRGEKLLFEKSKWKTKGKGKEREGGRALGDLMIVQRHRRRGIVHLCMFACSSSSRGARTLFISPPSLHSFTHPSYPTRAQSTTWFYCLIR